MNHVEYEKRSGQAADASDLSTAELVRHRMKERGMSVSGPAREAGGAAVKSIGNPRR